MPCTVRRREDEDLGRGRLDPRACQLMPHCSGRQPTHLAIVMIARPSLPSESVIKSRYRLPGDRSQTTKSSEMIKQKQQ